MKLKPPEYGCDVISMNDKVYQLHKYVSIDW